MSKKQFSKKDFFSEFFHLIFFVLTLTLLLMSGQVLPDLKFPQFIIFFLIALYFLLRLGCFADLKKPFSMFSMMYIFFLIIGAIPFFYLNGFDSKIARVILLGFFLYIFGYVLSRRVEFSAKAVQKQVNYYFDFPYLIYFFLIVSGLIGLFVFYYQVGGIPLLNKEMLSNRAGMLQGKGFGLQFFRFMALPFLLLLANDLIRSNKHFIDPIIAFFGLFCFVGLLSTGFRSMPAELFLMAVLIYLYEKRKRLTMINFFLISSIFIVFAAMVGLYREGMSEDISILFTSVKQLFLVSYVHFYNITGVFEKFPDYVPFQYGATYLMNFLMIRPGPDIDFTMWLKEQLEFSHFEGGATPSIMGEWYLNFGYPGIAGMFFMGIISAFLHRKLDNARNIFFVVKWVIITVYFLKTITGGISNVLLPMSLNLIVLEAIRITSKLSIFGRRRNVIE